VDLKPMAPEALPCEVSLMPTSTYIHMYANSTNLHSANVMYYYNICIMYLPCFFFQLTSLQNCKLSYTAFVKQALYSVFSTGWTRYVKDLNGHSLKQGNDRYQTSPAVCAPLKMICNNFITKLIKSSF